MYNTPRVIELLKVLNTLTESTLRAGDKDTCIAMLQLFEGMLPPIIDSINENSIKSNKIQ